MIEMDVEQGSEEWHLLRLGLPSASGYDRLVTPTGKPSSQLDGYVNELIAELLMGQQVKKFDTYYTLRGKELEVNARAWYEFHTDREVREVGFILRDDRETGCSPDGLTEFGGLEIKCPKADKHIGYLRGGCLPNEYRPQVQGSLWLCERDTWDFVSYHPDLPEFLVTVHRDEGYIKTLQSQVNVLIERKMEALEKILPLAA